jgi:hypothetical protein
MVDFTANDIVLMIGALSAAVCAILKLSRCEQINICGLLAFKRKAPAPTPKTDIKTYIKTDPNISRTPSTDTIKCDDSVDCVV